LAEAAIDAHEMRYCEDKEAAELEWGVSMGRIWREIGCETAADCDI
jgi:hypothetical protein